MKRALMRISFGVAFLALVSSSVIAQQRIHALSGTVKWVNPKIKMTEIITDNGTSGHFDWVKKSDGDVDFNKNVKAGATDADKFTSKGAHVIVFFIGEGDIRTIVALRDLGAVPLENASGTVVKLNRHDHVLTIMDTAGTEETFLLDAKTVGDTMNGVSADFKFDFSKGDEVHVTCAPSDDGKTALLIAPAM